MNFGSPTDAARIRTEKVLEQSVTQVPIVAVQITKVYNICIPEALTFDQPGWVGGFICLVNDNRSSTGSNVSDFRTLAANLCPFSGCHECEGFNGKVCSSELHSIGKLAETKYHRKMNSAELAAQSAST